MHRHRATAVESSEAAAAAARPDNTGAQRTELRGRVSVDDARANVPDRVGRYVVLDTVGVGGMGVVCTAYDPKLDRKVALKLLRRGRDPKRTQTSQARLVREAQALAKLSHPNIVTVHDVDTYGSQLYIAMEYVEGTSLDDWLEAERRDWNAIVDIFVRAGRGLAAAHVAGITHRDFKPGNVQLGDDGRVRVLDFGLAKNADDADPSLDAADSFPDLPLSSVAKRSGIMDLVGSAVDLKLTQVGRTVGTPAYMAPEQFYGLPVGPKTDQFAFGVSLYEALYERLPFGEPDRDDFVERVCAGRMSELSPSTNVPGWVGRVVLRMLQRKPDERYASMNAALVALTSDPARRRRRWLIGAGLTGMVVLSGYGAVKLVGARDEPCSGASEHITEVWDSSHRGQVEQAFLATATPFSKHAFTQASTELDQWTARWAEHHTAVCLATARGEQSEPLMDLRMACLDRGRAELTGLVDVFVEADARVVQQAVAAVQGLSDIDRCPTAQPAMIGALPDDPDLAAQARAVEQQRAQAEANILAGRYKTALQLATYAHAAATELGHPPTLARADKTLGTAHHYVGEDEAAAQHLAQAVHNAAVAGMPEAEAGAWSMLLFVEGDRLERHAEALGKRLAAESALVRAGSPAMAAASLATDLGIVYSRAGKADEGLAQHRNAVQLWRAVGGNRDGLAKALNNLGIALAQRHELEAARDALREALTIQRALAGALHPVVASQSFNLGHVLRDLGDKDGARERYRESLTIVEQVYGAEHPALAPGLVGLAKLEEEDDRAAAIERVARAVAILDGSGAPGRRLAITLATLAGMRTRAGQDAAAAGQTVDARAHWEQAQAELTRVVALVQGSPNRVYARAEGRRCHVASRLAAPPAEVAATCRTALQAFAALPDGPTGADPVQALVDYATALPPSRTDRVLMLDTALQWHLAQGSPPAEVAALRLQLAQWLVNNPETRDAARAMAERVRDATTLSAEQVQRATTIIAAAK